MQSYNLAAMIGKQEEVAVVQLPGVLAYILYCGGVSPSHVGQSCHQVSLIHQHHLTLVLHDLESQDGVAGVTFNLPLDLHLGGVTHNEKGDTGEPRGA